MSADVEGLRAEFIANGLDSLHSWRCEYPDRYGPCPCVDEFVRDFLASDWLRDLRAAERREGQRDGWDEGWKAGQHSRMTAPLPDENPCRDNQTGATR